LHPGTAHDETGLKFLWKRDPDSALEMEGYFIYSRKWSWKLTAVSLINIISRLGGDSCKRDDCSCGRDNLKVYEEAWELMDLVEESDPEINSLLSKAADRQFMTLRDQSAQNGKRSPAPATTMEEADAVIKELAKESENEAKKARKNDNGKDTPVDWEKLAAGITLYKICMSMDCSSGNLMELVKELQSTLAHIIGSCIEKVGVALVENNRKWAQEMEERKLLEAVYIAGKSKGLMEQLEWDPNREECYGISCIAKCVKMVTQQRKYRSIIFNYYIKDILRKNHDLVFIVFPNFDFIQFLFLLNLIIYLDICCHINFII
jgi:hypothetical protein